MLGLFNQIQAAGYYGAVHRLFSAVMSPAIILPNIYIPILTKKIKEKKSIKNTMRTLTITSLSGAILLVIVGVFFPDTIVNVVFGKEYLEATFALTILCITAGIFYINNIFFSLAFALYEDKKILLNNIFMSILNISLNMYIIPRYSFNGAAITTLISTIFMLIGNIYICQKALKKMK
jgi:O-antigen/teichoic acid export membrane protein